MSFLLDTNILTRAAQPSHPWCQTAVDAVVELRRRSMPLHLVPQNLYEFWSVATRPANANGLGMSVAEAVAELAELKRLYTILDETPAILREWEDLVLQLGVLGKSAHDAHLVAAMHVHGLSQILTFNPADFRRYSTITVVAPPDLLQRQTP